MKRLSMLMAAAGTVLALTGCCDLTITTTTLPDGFVGSPYSARLEGDCGANDWYLISGTMPPGLSLNKSGRIQGMPSLAGTWVFSVEVHNGSGPNPDVAAGTLSIKVLAPDLAVLKPPAYR